ncbi:hypothetical protein EV672_12117 [Aquabacterium commune]|uniref:Uncharacterized protein n=1 Tax=Aquabacterium commune TaxID=70586 RepID=A0A4R6QZQ8_9BURK|nr:hypothetical protein EV672_12117 [Aquabacterium commune]
MLTANQNLSFELDNIDRLTLQLQPILKHKRLESPSLSNLFLQIHISLHQNWLILSKQGIYVIEMGSRKA